MRWVTAVLAQGVLLSTLAGCASDRVKDLGGGRHSISACSEYGLTNPQVKVVQAAQKYCGKLGQMAVVEQFRADSCPTGNTSAVSAQFTCR